MPQSKAEVANTTAHDVCRYTFLRHNDPTWNMMVRQSGCISVADVPQPPCPFYDTIYNTVSIVKVKWILALRLRRIVTASCQWLLFHIKICSSPLLGFVAVHIATVWRGICRNNDCFGDSAFNFFQMAVDTGHISCAAVESSSKPLSYAVGTVFSGRQWCSKVAIRRVKSSCES
jgi:hypothetical protein